MECALCGIRFGGDGSPKSTPRSGFVDNDFLLPVAGNALGLACGLGASVLFLAKQGLTVSAWDISTFVISRNQGPKNPEYLFAPAELLGGVIAAVFLSRVFGVFGINRGLRNEAQFVGVKLASV